MDVICSFLSVNGRPITGRLVYLPYLIWQAMTYENYLELTRVTGYHEPGIRVLKTDMNARCRFVQDHVGLTELLIDLQDPTIPAEHLVQDLLTLPQSVIGLNGELVPISGIVRANLKHHLANQDRFRLDESIFNANLAKLASTIKI